MVAHTASPFPLVAPEDENLLIKPAVEGTLNVLRAIAKYNAMVEAGRKISRVVLTSSVVSCCRCWAAALLFFLCSSTSL